MRYQVRYFEGVRERCVDERSSVADTAESARRPNDERSRPDEAGRRGLYGRLELRIG